MRLEETEKYTKFGINLCDFSTYNFVNFYFKPGR